MATESNLRDLLKAADGDTWAPIDTRSVIRRSKARRLPMQIGVGGVFTLAIGGIGIAGLQGFSPQMMSGSPESSVASDESPTTPREEAGPLVGGQDSGAVGAEDAAGGGISRAPAEKINGCGSPLAEIAPSATGLVLTAAFPEAPAGSASIEGTVTMTNTGTETVEGYTPATPAVTLSRDGTVIWHSNGPTIQMIREVRLAPGESLTYAASVTPVVCGTEDETAGQFRDDLPAAPAGDYQVSAAIDLTVGERIELVSGPLAPLRLG
jgi:hypothetical protein